MWTGQGEGRCSSRCWEKSLLGSYRAQGSCLQSQQWKESKASLFRSLWRNISTNGISRSRDCGEPSRLLPPFLSVEANHDPAKGTRPKEREQQETGSAGLTLWSAARQNGEDPAGKDSHGNLSSVMNKMILTWGTSQFQTFWDRSVWFHNSPRPLFVKSNYREHLVYYFRTTAFAHFWLSSLW